MDKNELGGYSQDRKIAMTSTLTKNYWLNVFAGWVEARDMPGPQNDEALKVINELKTIASRLRCEIHGTEIVSDPDDPDDEGHCGECVIEDMKAAQQAVEAEFLSSRENHSEADKPQPA